jgi:4-hydroxythreonine-4-phosphate dehydrogenase
MENMKKPNSNSKLILTVGEPAGIGPDITCMLTKYPEVIKNLTIITDPDVIYARAKLLNISKDNLKSLNFYPIKYKHPVIPSKPNPDNSEVLLESIKIATKLCADKTYDAMITGPVNKAVINQAGFNFKFTGHTNFIADYLSEVKNQSTPFTPVMMFSYKNLKIALATVHIPLKDVAKTCTKEHLERTLEIIIQDLKLNFNLNNPKIAICGLNPHAGENGYLGDEEILSITPAIKNIAQRNPNAKLSGPLSADTLFYRALNGEFDLVLALFHDQALPAIKTISFGKAVNYSMGLPIIRTSVDHGTAEHLAGSKKASESSLVEAILLADQITTRRHFEPMAKQTRVKREARSTYKFAKTDTNIKPKSKKQKFKNYE